MYVISIVQLFLLFVDGETNLKYYKKIIFSQYFFLRRFIKAPISFFNYYIYILSFLLNYSVFQVFHYFSSSLRSLGDRFFMSSAIIGSTSWDGHSTRKVFPHQIIRQVLGWRDLSRTPYMIDGSHHVFFIFTGKIPFKQI